LDDSQNRESRLPADYGFSILDSGSHPTFRFSKIKPSKSKIIETKHGLTPSAKFKASTLGSSQGQKQALKHEVELTEVGLIQI
jgi:hypothetical protein